MCRSCHTRCDKEAGAACAPPRVAGVPSPHRKSFPISRSFHFSLSILILLLQSSPPAAQTSLSLPPILSFSTGRTVLLFFSSFNLSHYIKKGQHRIIRPSPLHCSFCSPDGEREGKFPLVWVFACQSFGPNSRLGKKWCSFGAGRNNFIRSLEAAVAGLGPKC